MLVSLTNPKTLFFYSAFFPQFISAEHDITRQVVVLSLTFLVLAMLLDGGWAVLAGRARAFLAGRGKVRNRISGGLLIGAGVGLALAHRK
jgi:threonine/homoserine/homoserine lactone efflux protein